MFQDAELSLTSENWTPDHFVPFLQPKDFTDFLDNSADDVVVDGYGPVLANTINEFDDDNDHKKLLKISGLYLNTKDPVVTVTILQFLSS